MITFATIITFAKIFVLCIAAVVGGSTIGEFVGKYSTNQERKRKQELLETLQRIIRETK